ncbi:MAG: VanZ family protein [Acidobacteriota bacterium]|jgi:VanZ family protein
MPSPKIWLRRWGPSLLMMALIFMASGTAGSDLPKFGIWNFIVMKGGHLVGYALLGVSYLHGIAGHKGMNRGALLAAIVLAGLYAVTDEFHQSFTPGRTPSAVDVGIDTIGAALGAVIWAWARSLRVV